MMRTCTSALGACIVVTLTIQFGAHAEAPFVQPGTHARQTATAEAAVHTVAGLVRKDASTTALDKPFPYGPPAIIFRIGATTYKAVHHISEWNERNNTWFAVSPDITEAHVQGAEGYGIDGITAVTTQRGTWYAGTLVGTLVAKHANTAWRLTPPSIAPDRTVTALAIDSDFQDGSVAAAGFAGYSSSTPRAPGHVYLTMDGGTTWCDVSGDLPDLPVQSLQFASVAGRHQLVAEQAGEWRKMEADGHWIAFSFTTR